MADKENKYRIYEITSQEPYLTEDKIKMALGHKSIKRALWICHDKDTYTEKTVKKEKERLEKQYKEMVMKDDKAFLEMGYKGVPDFETFYKDKHIEEVGKIKPKHWHCYIDVSTSPQTIKTIAKWFDTPSQNVEVKKGAGAFVDCLEYAVHDSESAKNDGKYPYPWEMCKTHGITVEDAKQMVYEKQVRRVKYGRDLTDKESVRMQVLNDGLSLRDASYKYPLLYAEDETTLKKMRSQYLATRMPLPKTRINYYLCGDGGIGKDTMAKGIARTLFPDLEDDELFHEVTDISVPFEGYDGQPVIIWSDMRAYDFIDKFGRGGTFKLFDLTPSRGRQNVKYSATPIVNSINIVNSNQPYLDFLNGLAGEYKDKQGNEHKAEDKKQAYRRFPVIIPINTDFFSIMLNNGWLDANGNFEEYRAYKKVSGNLARLVYDPRVRKLPREKMERAVKDFESKMCGMFPK